MAKGAGLRYRYYAVTVETESANQSERVVEKAGDLYSLVSSKAVHSGFHPLVVFLPSSEGGKKGGCKFLILGGIYRLWLHNMYL